MTLYTYDRSPALGLALVASADLREPRYQALGSAPSSYRTTSGAYLRQLHAVANGVATGLTVQQLRPLVAEQWDVLGGKDLQ